MTPQQPIPTLSASDEMIDTSGVRDQHVKRVHHTVRDVESFLKWSDRILGKARPAPRKARKPVLPKPMLAKPPKISTTPDLLPVARTKPAAVASVPLKPGLKPGSKPVLTPAPKPELKSGLKLGLETPTIRLSLGGESAKVYQLNPPTLALASQPMPNVPTYTEFPMHDLNHVPASGSRRVMKLVGIALGAGMALAACALGYAWYSTGVIVLRPEIAALSAMLVVIPPVITGIVGFTALRASSRQRAT